MIRFALILLTLLTFGVTSAQAQKVKLKCISVEREPVKYMTFRDSSTVYGGGDSIFSYREVQAPTGGYVIVTLQAADGTVYRLSPGPGKWQKYKPGQYYVEDMTDSKPPPTNSPWH